MQVDGLYKLKKININFWKSRKLYQSHTKWNTTYTGLFGITERHHKKYTYLWPSVWPQIGCNLYEDKHTITGKYSINIIQYWKLLTE